MPAEIIRRAFHLCFNLVQFHDRPARHGKALNARPANDRRAVRPKRLARSLLRAWRRRSGIGLRPRITGPEKQHTGTSDAGHDKQCSFHIFIQQQSGRRYPPRPCS